MDFAEFWRIIDGTRSVAIEDDDFLGKIDARLRSLAPREIVEFERHFRMAQGKAYSWKLWGAAYLLNGGCSDDGFEYFRAWLIAQGQQTFEKVLENPDSLVTLANPEGELEEFIYLAGQVYEELTGDEIPSLDHDGARLPELGEGWDFEDEAEMKKRYPMLFAKYCS